MPNYTLRDLLNPRDGATIFAEQLALLDSQGVNFGPSRFNGPRLLLRVACELAARWESLCAVVASSGFLDTAGKPFTDSLWLDLKAESDYRLVRIPAQAAVVRVRVTVASGAGPYSIPAAGLVASRQNAQRFTSQNTGTVTLSSAAATDIDFRAEEPGSSYNLSVGEPLVLLAALPGVSLEVLSVFALEAQTGSGPEVGGTGTPSADSTAVVQMVSGGARGTAQFKVSFDGGAFSTAHTTGASVDVGGGVHLTFAEGIYVVGEVYTLGVRASGMVQFGIDVEDDESYRQRCRDRWPLLSGRWTDDGMAALARAAAPGRLTSVGLSRHDRGPASVNLYLVEQGAPATVGTRAIVQDVLTRFRVLDSDPEAFAATAHNVSLTGTISCSSGATAAVKTELRARLVALQKQQQVGGVLRRARIIERIESIDGVVDVDLTGPSTNVTTTAPEFPFLKSPDDVVAGFEDLSGFTFVEVT